MAINNYNEKLVEPSQDIIGVPVIPNNLNNNSTDNSFNIMGIPSSNNDVINQSSNNILSTNKINNVLNIPVENIIKQPLEPIITNPDISGLFEEDGKLKQGAIDALNDGMSSFILFTNETVGTSFVVKTQQEEEINNRNILQQTKESFTKTRATVDQDFIEQVRMAFNEAIEELPTGPIDGGFGFDEDPIEFTDFRRNYEAPGGGTGVGGGDGGDGGAESQVDRDDFPTTMTNPTPTGYSTYYG